MTDLRPNDTEDAPFFYTFKVQCTSCREIHPNFVTVNRFEMNEQSGSKGEANFVWKCKNCKVVLPMRFLTTLKLLTRPIEGAFGECQVRTRIIPAKRPTEENQHPRVRL